LLSGMKIIPSVSFFPRTWLRDGFVRRYDYCFQVYPHISQDSQTRKRGRKPSADARASGFSEKARLALRKNP
jgi:hypothetical protein